MRAFTQATACYQDAFCSSCEYYADVGPRLRIVLPLEDSIGSSQLCGDYSELGASPDLKFRLVLAGSMMSDACTASAADETSVLGKYLTCQSKGATAACAFRGALSACGLKASNIHGGVRDLCASDCTLQLALRHTQDCTMDAICKKCRRNYYADELSKPCDVIVMAADMLSYQKYWSDKAGLVCDGVPTLKLLNAEAKCIAQYILQRYSYAATQEQVLNICSTHIDDNVNSGGTTSMSDGCMNIRRRYPYIHTTSHALAVELKVQSCATYHWRSRASAQEISAS
eukprot:6371-Heterococcus_DN1.PRE.2